MSGPLEKTGGSLALLDAAEKGDVRGIEKALADGASVDALRQSKTALMIAANNGNLDIVEKLVAAGAELHAYDASYFSPLHFAVMKQRYAVIEFLLEKGADINAQRNPGYSSSPLATAIFCDLGDGMTTRTEFLLQRGADPAVRSWLGWAEQKRQGPATELARAAPEGRGENLARVIETWPQRGEKMARLHGARSGKFRL